LSRTRLSSNGDRPTAGRAEARFTESRAGSESTNLSDPGATLHFRLTKPLFGQHATTHVSLQLPLAPTRDRRVPHPLAIVIGDGACSRAARADPLRPLSLARAHVRTGHHCLMAGVPRCAASLRDGRACGRTVVEGSEFCVHHDRLLTEHGADALKQGLPRRKQERSSWQPTIMASSSDDPEANSTGPTGHGRHSADPATVRPRLAEAAAESVEDIQRTLLDAATSASKPAWVEFECSDCGKRKRVEVPVPDVRARVAAIELLLREGLGRPAQAEERSTLPRIPEMQAEVEALGWDQLKALVLAYPEIEYLPETKREQWLVSRWVGLTQTERDSFSRRTRRGRREAGRAQHRLAGLAALSRDLTSV
jgi:hypothetical protein